MATDIGNWWALIVSVGTLVYGIFLLTYLNHTKKFSSQMTTRDKQFRTAAIVITWIEIISTGLACLGLLAIIIMGNKIINK